MKQAAIKIPTKTLPRMPRFAVPEGPTGLQRMSEVATAAEAPVKAIKPAKAPLNYAQMNAIERQAPSTIVYDSRGAKKYTPPQKNQ